MGSKKTVKCGKCDGRGKLHWLGHIDNGKCYACQGAGVLEVTARSVRDEAKLQANYAIGSLEEAGASVLVSNPTWVQHIARRAAAAMLTAADTDWSRKALARLPAELRSAVIAEGWTLRGAA